MNGALPVIGLVAAILLPITIKLEGASTDYMNLFAQIPVVALFAWFMSKMQERFDRTMQRRDEQFIAALNMLGTRMDKLADAIEQSAEHEPRQHRKAD